MMNILMRSIARAGGVEMPENMLVVEAAASPDSFVRRLAKAFERWNVRRSTYLTLKALDDRLLRDIGLHRSQLHDVADDIAGLAAANDYESPVALSQLKAANDNVHLPNAGCL